MWKNGAKFVGTFYLDKKEGYGTFHYPNGDKFEGLYKDNERFGPGVLTYKNPDQGQEVGIWHREKLVRLCTSAAETFFICDHSEFEYFPDEHHDRIDLHANGYKMKDMLTKENSVYAFLSQTFQKHVFSDDTALPLGIETYSKDFHNLPLTQSLKEQLDAAFFGEDYDQQREDSKGFLVAANNSSLAKEIQKHVRLPLDICSHICYIC